MLLRIQADSKGFVSKKWRREKKKTHSNLRWSRGHKVAREVLSGPCITVSWKVISFYGSLFFLNSNLSSCQNPSCGPSDALTFWGLPPSAPNFIPFQSQSLCKHFWHKANFFLTKILENQPPVMSKKAQINAASTSLNAPCAVQQRISFGGKLKLAFLLTGGRNVTNSIYFSTCKVLFSGPLKS